MIGSLFYLVKVEDEKRALATANIAWIVAEATHCAFMANSEIGEITAVIAFVGRNQMWVMSQTKIAQLRGFALNDTFRIVFQENIAKILKNTFDFHKVLSGTLYEGI